MNRQYPCLEISRSRLRHNMEEVISRCTARGIQVCGVIKGWHICSFAVKYCFRTLSVCHFRHLETTCPGALLFPCIL